MGGFKQIQKTKYAIACDGVIINCNNGATLKVNYATLYPSVQLSNNGLRKNIAIHRLVAVAFLPVISGKPEVNHIDGNKRNFSLSNLEWVTRSENLLHAYKTGLAKVSDKNRAIVSKRHSGSNHYNAHPVINNVTKETYPTIRAAAKASNIPVQTMHRKLHKNDSQFIFSLLNKHKWD